MFQPVAIKTTSVYVKSTALFLNNTTKTLVEITGDPRE